MKRTLWFMTSIFLLIQFPLSAFAEKSMEELSKEIANPLAQIWNLSFQYNYTRIGGDPTGRPIAEIN
jgi:hypothetical protein